MNAYAISLLLQRIISLLTCLFLPLVLFFLVFNKNMSTQFTSSESINYVRFLLIGMIGYSTSFSIIMSVGRSIVTEFREGTYQAYVMSGGSTLEYILIISIPSVISALLESSIVVLISLLIPNGALTLSLNLLFMYILLLIVSLSISVFAGAVMLMYNNTYTVQNTLSVIIGFFCGISFPITLLPEPLKFISNLIPLTSSLYSFRQVMQLNYQLKPDKIYFPLLLSITYFITGIFLLNYSISKRLESS